MSLEWPQAVPECDPGLGSEDEPPDFHSQVTQDIDSTVPDNLSSNFLFDIHLPYHWELLYFYREFVS